MPRKPKITNEQREAWEATIRAAVHPQDYKVTNIDDVIPVADHEPVQIKEEAKVQVEDKVEVNDAS
jgi:hypothetical protein